MTKRQAKRIACAYAAALLLDEATFLPGEDDDGVPEADRRSDADKARLRQAAEELAAELSIRGRGVDLV